MSTALKPLLKRNLTGMVGLASVIFFASKATAFFTPMLLAKMLPAVDYGTIELALAWATPSAILVGFGLHAAVPYFLLKLNRPESKRVFFLHVAGSSLALVLLTAAASFLPLPRVVLFALLITAMFTAQNIYAALFKTEGRPALASFTEVAIYCVLFVFAAGFAAAHIGLTLHQILLLLFATTGLVLAISSVFYYREPVRAGLFVTFCECFLYGRPIILSSILGVLLMSGGRILIGALLGVADVAVFSLLYRMAAAAVLVHQLSTTIIFAKYYKLDAIRLNKLMGAILGLVFLATLSIAIVGQPIGKWLFPLLRSNPALIHQVLIAICIQMFFWCSSAQTELIFYRENMGGTYAKLLAGVFALLVAGSYGLKLVACVSLMSLANLQMAVTFIANVGGLLLLWRRSMRLPIPIILSTAVFAGYWIEYASYAFLHGTHRFGFLG